jgi:hypothetical protein
MKAINNAGLADKMEPLNPLNLADDVHVEEITRLSLCKYFPIAFNQFKCTAEVADEVCS